MLPLRSLAPLLAASLTLSAAIPSYALPHTIPSAHLSLKPRMVQFKLRNELPDSVDLLVGEKPVSIESKGSITLKAAEGTHVLYARTTAHHAAGDLAYTVLNQGYNIVVTIR